MLFIYFAHWHPTGALAHSCSVDRKETMFQLHELHAVQCALDWKTDGATPRVNHTPAYVYCSLFVVRLANAFGIYERKQRHLVPSTPLESAFKKHRGRVPSHTEVEVGYQLLMHITHAAPGRELGAPVLLSSERRLDILTLTKAFNETLVTTSVSY